ncbi:TlpA disulfide reductase family protein [Thiohalomonas denitrificans]|uniref:TlpA disulfide reductase family protein n=1 Tax=Thiohalomonas denitrificans TaxID=415747 RepID=UPI0026EBBAD5|nr:TlpA disulfide reductase family protein [Thiohalomonas denitrificans]
MRTKEIAIAVFALLLIGLMGYVWFTPGGANKAPDVTVSTLDGEPLHLADLRDRPVVWTFWATTCPSCVKEIPHLIELQQKLGDQGLAVVGVAMSYDPPDQVKEMVRQRDMTYTIALDDGSAAHAFGDVTLTPTTFLINPEGRIVQQKLGELDMEALERRIIDMLNETSSN